MQVLAIIDQNTDAVSAQHRQTYLLENRFIAEKILAKIGNPSHLVIKAIDMRQNDKVLLG